MTLKRPKETKFEFPQPEHPYPPTHRSGAFIGPSGVGKTSTAISMLMGPYKKLYSRVWVFSPSCEVGVDPAWDAWRKFNREELGVPDTEQTLFNVWDPNKLKELIAEHSKVNSFLKAQGHKHGYAALVLIDDFADDPRVLHNPSNPITSIFVRGRHLGVACWLLTQKLRVINLTARTNFCWMLVWRLRNYKEKEQVFEELSAMYPRKILEKMYTEATDKPHGFWYINLLSDTRDMSFAGFDHKMLVS